jgi:hypothetical protein
LESQSPIREVAVSESNPDDCTPDHDCTEHDADHRHGPDCGHEPVRHGDHVDYVVAGQAHRISVGADLAPCVWPKSWSRAGFASPDAIDASRIQSRRPNFQPA